MQPLTIVTLLDQLEQQLEQIAPKQILDPTHPQYGGIVHPDFGLAEPHSAIGFISTIAYLCMNQKENMAAWLERANLAADYLLKAQRPSGRIDLLSVNYDSSPDTGFAVQLLCTVIELSRVHHVDSHLWIQLLAKIESFIRRAVPGMISGGFHTPNHRWVITSALVQAKALFPDLVVEAAVTSYLAEGFDLDEEGMYIERSVGTYDAVNDRSLLLINENWDAPGALEAVQKNLDLDLRLLHADGTAETGLSRRQDYGTRAVPVGLAPCFLLLNAVKPSPLFEAAALYLWEHSPDNGGNLLWLLYPLMKYGEPESRSIQLPENYTFTLTKNGIWRSRRGLLSASAFQATTRLFSLVFGDAELSSVKISQTYFGYETGWFISDEMETVQNGVALISKGQANPRRPGYEMPLGRPVDPDLWDETKKERDLYRLPPALSRLTFVEADNGFDLHYQTLDGMDRVAAQVAFDFPPGGIWETADTSLKPQKGQVIFLKQGSGRMKYGNDVIEISPGAHAHTMWEMREAQTAPDSVRVLLTYLTPVDVKIKIRTHRGV